MTVIQSCPSRFIEEYFEARWLNLLTTMMLIKRVKYGVMMLLELERKDNQFLLQIYAPGSLTSIGFITLFRTLNIWIFEIPYTL